MTDQPTPAQQSNNDLDLSSVLNILWGRRDVIAAITVAITLIVTIVLLQLRSEYTATASIMIDSRKTQVTDFESVVSGLQVNDAVVRSEMAIMTSQKLAGRVVKKLDLLQDPEFNSDLQGNGGIVAWLRRQLGKTTKAAPKHKTINAVLKNFSAENDGKSYVIHVKFRSESPEKAAKIANTWAEQYLVNQLEVKYETTQRANEWLSVRLAELKEKVAITDNAVIKAREQHNIVNNTDGESIASRQMTELNTQLVLAQAERAQSDARLRRARQLAGSSGYDSIVEVISSPLIQSLREKESELRRKEAEMATRYGDRHPSMINVRAEIRDLSQKIKEEVSRIMNSLASEVEVARARENTIQSQLKNAEGKVTTMNRAQIEVDQLQREADANRALYESFLSRFKQTFAQDDFQQADASIISEAVLPENPSFPKRKIMFALALVGSFIFGVFVALVLELLNNTFRTPVEVERSLGIKTIAMIPLVAKAATGNITTFLREHITGQYAEAVRSTLTTLQLSRGAQGAAKVILITSTQPDEGKTFFSISLANIAAMGGKKVLVIDADLRKPTVSQKLQVKFNKTLGDYLNGNAAIKDIMYRDSNNKVDYCLATTNVQVPQAALGSDAMRALLDMARQHYDYVVIDSPPLLAVSDTLVLAPLADQVLYVIHHDKTTRKSVRNGVRLYAQSGAETPMKAVLTQVNIVKHARYGYGDEAQYYGRYGDYYTKSAT